MYWRTQLEVLQMFRIQLEVLQISRILPTLARGSCLMRATLIMKKQTCLMMQLRTQLEVLQIIRILYPTLA